GGRAQALTRPRLAAPDLSPGLRVPDAHRPVSVPRGQQLAVRGETDAARRVRPVGECGLSFLRAQIPEFDGAGVLPGARAEGDGGTVGREGDTEPVAARKLVGDASFA